MCCDFVCFYIIKLINRVMCSEIKHTVWTSEQDEILIDFVRSNECLYNVQCKDYRKTQLKQSLWKEIAQILQITVNDCSKRWGYVRDYYIKRRGKPGTGSSGEAAKKRSEQLSFLECISSGKRSTLGNIEKSETQENVEIDNSEQQQSELFTADDTSSNISDIQEAVVETEKTPRVTKRKHTTTSTPADERLKILKQIAERQDQKNMEKQDENDLFFGSMAKITKKLPKVVQARLRMEIGNLVGNAEIEHLSPLPSADYGPGPSSAGSSTSYSTFVSDDSVTLMGSSTTSVMDEEPSQRYFTNL